MSHPPPPEGEEIDVAQAKGSHARGGDVRPHDRAHAPDVRSGECRRRTRPGARLEPARVQRADRDRGPSATCRRHAPRDGARRHLRRRERDRRWLRAVSRARRSAESTDSEDAAATAAGNQVLQSLLPSRPGRRARWATTRTRSKPSSTRECHRPRSMAVWRWESGRGRDDRRAHGRRHGSADQFFTEGTGAGDWRNLVAPLSPTGNNFKWVGDVEPFLIPDAVGFRDRRVRSRPVERRLRGRVQPGEVARSRHRLDEDRRPDRDGAVLGRPHGGDVDADLPSGLGERRSSRPPRTRGTSRCCTSPASDAAIACFQDKERHGLLAAARPRSGCAEIDGNPATIDDDGLDVAARESRRTRTTRRVTTASAARSCRRCGTSSGRTRCPSARCERPRRSGRSRGASRGSPRRSTRSGSRASTRGSTS